MNIKGVTDDSRKVKEGYVFVAIKGTNFDGHNYINDAINNGASIIYGEKDLKINGVKYIKVKNSRKEFGLLTSDFYGNPSKKMKIIGVTGTDGKTTTANIIYEILKNSGKNVGLISTINAKIGDKSYDTGFHVTSPEPSLLHEILGKMVKQKCEYAILEVTSHGLDQERFAGIDFLVGALTNITHEHLDYHKTFQNYVTAKGKLFNNVKFAVINNNNESKDLIKKYISRKAKIIYYDFENLDDDLKKAVKKRFGETYNFENATCAIEVVKLFDINNDNIINSISKFPQLSGRMEKIDNKKEIEIYIDFAHTPNALENVLDELKKNIGVKNKLIVVFGCASERDIEKRPMMGEIAARLSDAVILTAEDPRNEDINNIFKDIEKGIKNKENLYKIPDRYNAIDYAVNKIAKKGDIVVVCGKGHEKSMNIKGVEYPWSDKEAVEKALLKK